MPTARHRRPEEVLVTADGTGAVDGPAVVGAAAVRSGRVLLAQRRSPPELAGCWEFPGGKVEPGESETEALVRECAEELGVFVAVGERLGPALVLPAGGRLNVYLATLVSGAVTAHEHAAVGWFGPDELDALDWIPADRPLLPYLRAALGGGTTGADQGHCRA